MRNSSLDICKINHFIYRFGRLTLIVFGTVFASIFGIIKSFSVNYGMYIVVKHSNQLIFFSLIFVLIFRSTIFHPIEQFELFEASVGACVFETIYVLGIECVHSRHHVLGSTIISISYSLGSILLGLLAMNIHNFRTLIRILYPPGLIVFAYLWLLPESVRWLLITGRVDRAIKTLKRVARFNGKVLSSKSIEIIRSKYSIEASTNKATEKESGNKRHSLGQLFAKIFKSKKLRARYFICCYQV